MYYDVGYKGFICRYISVIRELLNDNFSYLMMTLEKKNPSNPNEGINMSYKVTSPIPYNQVQTLFGKFNLSLKNI